MLPNSMISIRIPFYALVSFDASQNALLWSSTALVRVLSLLKILGQCLPDAIRNACAHGGKYQRQCRSPSRSLSQSLNARFCSRNVNNR